MEAVTKCNVNFQCVRWNENNIAEILAFCKYCYIISNVMFYGYRGTIRLNKGDYVCKINSEFVVLSKEQFDSIAIECENENS